MFCPRARPARRWSLNPTALNEDNGNGDDRKTVFYFPGCGSERLYSDISMAAIHLLLKLGTRVILPPPFLCCGFPAHVNAETSLHSRTVLRDTILFSQIRAMFAYLDFDACVVTCGTCREGLTQMDTDRAVWPRGGHRGLSAGARTAAWKATASSSTTRRATIRSTARQPRC